MALPFKRVTLHLRDIALIREMAEFCAKNGFYDKRFRYDNAPLAGSIADKLLFRLNKHYRKLLHARAPGGCTGCGATPKE